MAKAVPTSGKIPQTGGIFYNEISPNYKCEFLDYCKSLTMESQTVSLGTATLLPPRQAGLIDKWSLTPKIAKYSGCSESQETSHLPRSVCTSAVTPKTTLVANPVINQRKVY